MNEFGCKMDLKDRLYAGEELTPQTILEFIHGEYPEMDVDSRMLVYREVVTIQHVRNVIQWLKKPEQLTDLMVEDAPGILRYIIRHCGITTDDPHIYHNWAELAANNFYKDWRQFASSNNFISMNLD